jgi:peroxiredoxin
VREAEGLRDRWEELHGTHQISVIGVSPADAPAHRAFIAAHQLPFDYAGDADGTIARAFTSSAAAASADTPTFLVGHQRRVLAAYPEPDTAAQAREALARLGQ